MHSWMVRWISLLKKKRLHFEVSTKTIQSIAWEDTCLLFLCLWKLWKYDLGGFSTWVGCISKCTPCPQIMALELVLSVGFLFFSCSLFLLVSQSSPLLGFVELATSLPTVFTLLAIFWKQAEITPGECALQECKGRRNHRNCWELMKLVGWGDAMVDSITSYFISLAVLRSLNMHVIIGVVQSAPWLIFWSFQMFSRVLCHLLGTGFCVSTVKLLYNLTSCHLWILFNST